jgi:hypothetical protein
MYPNGAAEPRRGIIHKTTGVVAAVESGALLERSMAREIFFGWKGKAISLKAAATVTH